MISNYLKTTVRNMRRHVVYSLLNVLGLAIGMASCILIFLYVHRELSYDRYHQDGDRVFRIAQQIRRESTEFDTARVATPLIPAVRGNFPEVESAARFQLATWDSLVERGEVKHYEEWVMIAENEIFDVFTIPFLRGEPEEALRRPSTVVITERVAQRYFGQDDAIGQTLLLWGRPVEVTGVVANCPKNSHLKYEIIVSLKGFEKTWNLENWGWTGFYAYVKLKPQTDPENFEGKIRHLADLYVRDELEAEGVFVEFYLQPLASIHLRSHLVAEIGAPGNPRDIALVSALGLLILLISCINFMNLATARSAKRAKEVGVRKVLGAWRMQLARQFLFESLLASLVSLALSLLIVVLVLPFFTTLAGQSFSGADLFNPLMIFGLLGFSLGVGLMAGSYPALLLSRFKPASALKEGKGSDRHGAVLRKALVIIQFAVTVVLVIGTLTVRRQIRFMKNEDLGFDRHQKLIIPADLGDRVESVKKEFLNTPAVTGVSAVWNAPGRLANLIEARLVGETDEKAQSMNFYYVDSDFIPEYKIEIVAGRPFQKDIQTDVEGAYVLNETAAEAFGFSSPEEALGKRMYEGGSGGVGTIIGVTKDFHYKGLQTRLEPLVLQWRPDFFSYLSLTVNTENLARTISMVEEKWNDLRLGRLFAYFFLDEDFNRHYRSEESQERLYATLTFLALFISCLGLAGLSSFAAEQRTKEIGIRKILGASEPNLLLLLVGEFTKAVLLANVIAWPVSYLVINRWLRGFAYRTTVPIWIFGLAAAVALSVAALTVGFQSIKAATADPVRSLRYE